MNPSAPDKKFKLDYVFGFRTYDARQNLFINNEGKLVYMVAALGVVLNVKDNTQKFFGGNICKPGGAAPQQHDDDILCLSISPNRELAATGQVGASPKLFVWNTNTLAVVSQYKLGKNTRGIIACRFSNDGKYVAFVDNSNDHMIYVITANDGKLVMTQKTGPDPVTDLIWSQKPGDTKLCVVGVKLVKYSSFPSNSIGSSMELRQKRGSVESLEERP